MRSFHPARLQVQKGHCEPWVHFILCPPLCFRTRPVSLVKAEATAGERRTLHIYIYILKYCFINCSSAVTGFSIFSLVQRCYYRSYVLCCEHIWEKKRKDTKRKNETLRRKKRGRLRDSATLATCPSVRVAPMWVLVVGLASVCAGGWYGENGLVFPSWLWSSPHP